MFFEKKITLIRPQDRVLEIGPGSSPHSRSNAFLELAFDQHEDKISQRGGIAKDAGFGGRPVYYYDGTKFPFEAKQFDYVICSHVIEHVTNPVEFLSEVFRVSGGRGYLEYPLITYEYLYDFNVHLQFVKFDSELQKLWYVPKSDTSFSEFAAVSGLFNRMLQLGWDDLCSANKAIFFEGFEFNREFAVEKSPTLAALLPDLACLREKSFARKFIGRLLNKMGF
jgi:SAM-dependent methyltransferase